MTGRLAAIRDIARDRRKLTLAAVAAERGYPVRGGMVKARRRRASTENDE